MFLFLKKYIIISSSIIIIIIFTFTSSPRSYSDRFRKMGPEYPETNKPIYYY